MKVCPYCQFEKDGPYNDSDLECPKCQRIYSKFKPDDYNLEKTVGLGVKSKTATLSKLISWLLSIILIYSAISSIVAGHTFGFGRLGNPITFEANPVEFGLKVFFVLFIGLYILVKNLSKSR